MIWHGKGASTGVSVSENIVRAGVFEYMSTGEERWFRCDTKVLGKALYGRLKARTAQGKYFENHKGPLRGLALEYMLWIPGRECWDSNPALKSAGCMMELQGIRGV